MNLDRSCFLSSQHNEWFATRESAMGSSCWQRKFPHVFRAEEGDCGLWVPSLSAASVLGGAAARLLPLCSPGRQTAHSLDT